MGFRQTLFRILAVWLTRKSRFTGFSFAVGVLVCSSSLAFGVSQTYHVTIDNTWSTTTHPGLFPFEAHFSWFGGGTHNDQVAFWTEGQLASPGMVQMAETGFTTILRQEIAAARNAGNADVDINQDHWFCPLETNAASCGDLGFDMDVNADWPLVTLVSMLGPSPDWFVGVDSLPLTDANGWRNEVVVDLRPYDGGTRDANVFALFGPRTMPPEAITLITEASGQIITPASLGSMIFRRVLTCDFDDDADCDLDDLNSMLAEGPIASGVSVTPGVNDHFDLTGNDVIDNNDRGLWLASAGEVNGFASPYKVGDANLDGTVDGLDFIAWNDFKFTSALRWDQGDFNGDGVVDGGDFINWNNQKFTASDVAAVPEPSTAALLVLLALGCRVNGIVLRQT